MKYFVTGAGGFVGSNLIDVLLADSNNKIVGYDNFSTGKKQFLTEAQKHLAFTLIEGDIHDTRLLKSSMEDCDFVFHLAANADVRSGLQNTKRDLEQNLISTHYVLEAMRVNKIKKIAFSSTASVYGNADIIPTPERTPFPIQTSLYGASKVAAESIIQAYCEGFDFQTWIFRFVSMLGERYHHGFVFDFYKKLKQNPKGLNVLGDGTALKSYVYIQDAVEGMLTAINKSHKKVNVFNVGQDHGIFVNQGAKFVTDYLGLGNDIIYETNKKSGWIGDNPCIILDCSKLRKLGWIPKISIETGIQRTLDYIKQNEWLLED